MEKNGMNEKTKRAYRKTSETQKIIFDKAMQLMSEKGFQGTTVRDICAEANIPIGTFYNCYKSKIDIPVGKWIKCEECKEIIYIEKLKQNSIFQISI